MLDFLVRLVDMAVVVESTQTLTEIALGSSVPPARYPGAQTERTL